MEVDRTNNDSNDSKRRRISKACDNCRKRKVKCDGLSPCQNCVNGAKGCTYNYIQKKRDQTKRIANNRTIRDLSSRMEGVESLLEKLTNKLITKKPGHTVITHNHNHNVDSSVVSSEEYDDRSSEEEDDEDDDEDDAGLEDEFEIEEEEQELESRNSYSELKYTISYPDMAGEGSLTLGNGILRSGRTFKVEIYFGNHSTLSLFSPRGLAWVQSKLGSEKDYVNPLKRLHIFAHHIHLRSLQKWIEPVEKTEVTPLPEEHKTMKLAEFFSKSAKSISVFEKDEVEGIFRSYYSNLKSGRHNTYSELLVMNAVLCLATSLGTSPSIYRHHMMKSSNSSSANSAQSSPSGEYFFSPTELNDIQEKTFLNSIYYYHRICMISDGLRAIQGIAILATFLETTISSQANYMLISTLVRFAHELGLNRQDSYVGLPPRELERRRKIWWYCYYLDRDTSLKTGKPPIISDHDVSTFIPSYFHHFLDKSAKKITTRNNQLINAATYKVAMEKGFGIYVTLYTTQISRITSKANRYLFSAKSLKGKTHSQILKIIDKLNEELTTFKNLIDEPMRPGAMIDLVPYEDIKDEVYPETRLYHCLIVHFNYYFHIMTINRFAFKTPWASSNTEQEIYNSYSRQLGSMYANKCLDAAREILRISRRIDRSFTTFLSWAIFYPFTAFITLFCSVISSPKDMYAEADLKLLVDVSLYLFKNPIFNSQHTIKLEFFDLVMRQMLKVAIRVYESENKTIFATDDLRNYLDDVQSYRKFLKTGEIDEPSNSINGNTTSSDLTFVQQLKQELNHFNLYNNIADSWLPDQALKQQRAAQEQLQQMYRDPARQQNMGSQVPLPPQQSISPPLNQIQQQNETFVDLQSHNFPESFFDYENEELNIDHLHNFYFGES